MHNYAEVGADIGALVDKKNAQYGDSINDCGEFLKILYPQGIPVSAYRDLGIMIRMFDKMKRLAGGNQGDENAWKDLAGYGILGYGGEVRREENRTRTSMHCGEEDQFDTNY